MDVIPVVAKEIATRYHQKLTGSSPSPTDGGGAATTLSTGGGGTSGGNNVAAAGVTPELATLLTRLRLLGVPNTDAAGNVGETAENIEALVEELVGFLLRDCSTPNLSTMMLQSQVYALKNSIRNKRRTAEVKREAVTMRLTEAIVDKANASPDEILGDVTLYILHRYGQLSSESDGGLPVHKETAAVLCSVLPRGQVSAFVRQDAVEKQRQLEELRRIVWGVRIFNREEGKTSGVGIESVHPLVETPLTSIESKLSRECEALAARLIRTRAVLLSPTCALKPHEMRLLREEYHHMLQVQHCLLVVRCMYETLSARIHSFILPKYDGALTELRAVFAKSAIQQQQQQQASGVADEPQTAAAAAEKAADAVPRRIVYPLFVEIAEAYESATKTVEEFDEIRSLLDLALASQRSYLTALTPSTADAAMKVCLPTGPVRDRAALSTYVDECLNEHTAAHMLADYDMYYATELPGSLFVGGGGGDGGVLNDNAVVSEWYPSSTCGLRGFCPVQYVLTGLLVPGRVDMTGDEACAGFIVVEGGAGRLALARPMCLAFADETSLRAFADDPLRYFLACIESSNATEPGVTLLMGLLERLPRELYIAGARSLDVSDSRGVLGSKGHDSVARAAGDDEDRTADAGTQTGQMDSYIDHNYRWNEWDLRRQALKLANLINMRTHSTQTVTSHFRRDNSTQARPPKTTGVQTMQDAAVQPPRVVQYLKGLRGTASSEVEQVQQTFLY